MCNAVKECAKQYCTVNLVWFTPPKTENEVLAFFYVQTLIQINTNHHMACTFTRHTLSQNHAKCN